jgi:hypothetical protein
MKVTGTKVTKSEIASIIDLKDELKGVPRSDREELKERIGELLVEQTLESLADAKSPVDGAPYKSSLSKAYGEFKQDENGNRKANLDLTGDMISALDFKIEGDKIKIGIFDPMEAPKADGHNNFSGDSKLPARQFLPKKGEEYKSEIAQLIRDTIADYKADIIKDSDLSKIESKSDLYDFLSEYVGADLTRRQLKDIALGSKKLTELLDDNDLLDLL